MAAERLGSSAIGTATSAGPPGRGSALSSFGRFSSNFPSPRSSEFSLGNFKIVGTIPKPEGIRTSRIEVPQAFKDAFSSPARPVVNARNLFNNTQELRITPREGIKATFGDQTVDLSEFRGARRPTVKSGAAALKTTRTRLEAPKQTLPKTEIPKPSGEAKLKQSLSEIKPSKSDSLQVLQKEAQKPVFRDSKIGQKITEVISQVDKSTIALDSKTAGKVRLEVSSRLQKDPQTFLKGKSLMELPAIARPTKESSPTVDQAVKHLNDQAKVIKDNPVAAASTTGEQSSSQVQKLTAKTAEVKALIETKPRSKVDSEVDQILRQIGLEPVTNARLKQLEPQPNVEPQLNPQAAIQEAERITAVAKSQPVIIETPPQTQIEIMKHEAPKTELLALAQSAQTMLEIGQAESQVEETLVQAFQKNQVLSETLQNEGAIRLIIQQIVRIKNDKKEFQQSSNTEVQNFVVDEQKQQNRAEDSYLAASQRFEEVSEGEYVYGSELVNLVPGQTARVNSLGREIDGSWAEYRYELGQAGRFESFQQAIQFMEKLLNEKPAIKLVRTPHANVSQKDIERVFDERIEELVRGILGHNNISSSLTQRPALVGVRRH